MNVYIKHFNSGLRPDQKMVIDEFIKFHQKKIPLKNDIEILFLGERLGHMTTGSRGKCARLKILTRNRMLIDVLRTLSHELTHEFEHENMRLDFSQEIGGKSENLANSVAGATLKMFQREYPQYLGLMYE